MRCISMMVVIVSVLSAGLLVGCGHSGDDEASGGGAAASQRSHEIASGEGGEPLERQDIIRLGEGFGPITFGMTETELMSAAGAPQRQQGRGAYEYLEQGYAVVLDRQGRVAAIMCGGIYKDSPMVARFSRRTAEGIRMGSSPEDVTRAYGEPDEMRTSPQDPTLKIMKYGALGVEFSFRNDSLVHMIVLRLREQR